MEYRAENRLAGGVLALAPVLFGALMAAACGRQASSTAARPPAPASVVAERAERRDVPLISELVGRTEADADVEIRANVEGRLEEASFTEGSMVAKGQKLFRIDSRRYQAAMQLARAAVEKAEADLELAREQQHLVNAQSALRQAEADLLRSSQDLERLKPLAARRAVPERDLDQAIAAHSSAQAAAEDARATVKTTMVSDRMGLRQAEANLSAARASLAAAQLDLDETEIRAPISGRIGRIEVAVGNYVGRGQATPLATISQIDPIHLIFNIPEQLYLRIISQGADKAGIENIELTLSDDRVYPYRGRFASLGRAVATKTGTLEVDALFPNPRAGLLPGMFGRVRVAVETRANAVLVSERALFDVQGSRAVWIVTPEKTVALRSVATEGTHEGKAIITSGLSGGETVVIEGLMKLRPGVPVQVRNAAPDGNQSVAK